METYPIIKIPIQLNEIQNLEPPLIEIPSAPKQPERKPKPAKPNQDNAPKQPTYEGSGSGTGWLFLGMGILFIIISANMRNPPVPAVIGGFGFTALGIFIIASVVSSNNRKKEEFNKKLREFPSTQMKFEENYKRVLNTYNHQLQKDEDEYKEKIHQYNEVQIPLYLKQLEAYEKQASLIRSKDNVLNFRKIKLKEFLSKIKKPGIHPASTEIRKGVSEASFHTLLLKEFKSSKGSIHQDYTIKFLNSAKSYLPDFTYYDSSTGICIDVEIDEPYIGSNGEPIHYVESNDDQRDSYFIDNGWIVIRFAEEQIVKYPDSCCQIIKNVINNISELGDSDHEINLLIPIKRWTKEEAHKMAFKRIRNSYLGIKLAEELENENHESPEDASVIATKTKEGKKNNRPTLSESSMVFDDDLPF